MQTQQIKKQPCIRVFNLNSRQNKVHTYPAIHLSCYEFHNPGKNVVKFRLQEKGAVLGVVR